MRKEHTTETGRAPALGPGRARQAATGALPQEVPPPRAVDAVVHTSDGQGPLTTRAPHLFRLLFQP